MRLNPDAGYHIGLAREAMTQGIVREIPQADNIFWKDEFVNKELLYHFTITVTYSIGGENAVFLLGRLMAMCLIALVFFFCTRLSRSVWLASLVTIFLLSNHILLTRIHFVRPHTLSIILFCINIYAILNRNGRWIFITSFLMPLSYHLFYLAPVNLVFGYIAFRSSFRRLFWIGIMATLGGIVLNPYFPSNLLMFFHILKMSFKSMPIERTTYPREFVSPPHWSLIGAHLGMFAALGFQIYRWSRSKKLSPENSFLLMLTSSWYLLSILNIRAIEYAYPALALLIAQSYRSLDINRSVMLYRAAFAIVFVSVVLNVSIQFVPPHGGIAKARELTSMAIASIPKGEKVLNCLWSAGVHIFYKRPDIKMVDVLSPYFLYEQNFVAHRIRERLLMGQLSDPLLAMSLFKADYSFCKTYQTNLQLELDPRFVRVFPHRFQDEDHLRFDSVFRVDRRFVRPFLNHYLPSGGRLIEAKLDDSGRPTRSMFSWSDLRDSGANIQDECALLQAPKEAVRDRAGAEYIGFGGGLEIVARINETSFKLPKRAGDSRSVLNRMGRLKRPLQSGDRLKLRVCRSRGEKEQNAEWSVSLWKREELEELCQTKGRAASFLVKKSYDSDSKYLSIDLCAHYIAKKKAAR